MRTKAGAFLAVQSKLYVKLIVKMRFSFSIMFVSSVLFFFIFFYKFEDFVSVTDYSKYSVGCLPSSLQYSIQTREIRFKKVNFSEKGYILLIHMFSLIEFINYYVSLVLQLFNYSFLLVYGIRLYNFIKKEKNNHTNFNTRNKQTTQNALLDNNAFSGMALNCFCIWHLKKMKGRLFM